MTHATVQRVVDYYAGRTYIAPQDVSQELFKFNLTQIDADLNSTTVTDLVAALQTSGGQAVISRASTADQASINALSTRLSALATNLGNLNNQIQVTPHFCFSGKALLWSLLERNLEGSITRESRPLKCAWFCYHGRGMQAIPPPLHCLTHGDSSQQEQSSV